MNECSLNFIHELDHCKLARDRELSRASYGSYNICLFLRSLPMESQGSPVPPGGERVLYICIPDIPAWGPGQVVPRVYNFVYVDVDDPEYLCVYTSMHIIINFTPAFKSNCMIRSKAYHDLMPRVQLQYASPHIKILKGRVGGPLDRCQYPTPLLLPPSPPTGGRGLYFFFPPFDAPSAGGATAAGGGARRGMGSAAARRRSASLAEAARRCAGSSTSLCFSHVSAITAKITDGRAGGFGVKG